MKTIEDKIFCLKEYLKDKKCILAYSGGSDSTLLAYILSEVSPKSLLVTIDNNLMSDDFIAYTELSARNFHLEHKIIKLDFFEDEEILLNNDRRCYNCRCRMFESIEKMENFGQYEYFIEGTNITDLLEYRPGIIARNEHKMISPLIECGIQKQDVYDILKYLNLDYSKNTTCYATRIKTNEKLTKEKIEKTIKGEKILNNIIKQKNVRLRINDNIASITTNDPFDITKEELKEITRELRKLDFDRILLDLTGYEQTELEIMTDEDNTYYYQLPYRISIEDNEKYEVVKNRIIYKNITIDENGKISSIDNEKFEENIFEVLPLLKMKKIERRV